MGSGNTEVHLTEERQLGESLSKRLAAYALAAGAAGVEVLALAPLGHASGIEFVKNADITIGINSTAYLAIGGVNVLEFTDRETHSTRSMRLHTFGTLSVKPLNGGAVAGAPVASGVVIGPRSPFLGAGSPQLAFNSYSSSRGGHSFNPWGPGRFLPFEFVSKGNPYFGWASFSVRGSERAGLTGYIPEFAYNTTPDADIAVGQTSPEPGTLALLALGALGLAALRKRKPSTISGPSAS